MKIKFVIVTGVLIAAVAVAGLVLALGHESAQRTPREADHVSRTVPARTAAAVRLLVSARGREALTPELNAVLPPGRLFSAGTTFTPQPGSWQQTGAYANITGTLRVPGRSAENAEVGLVHRARRWLVTFEEAQ
jgi:hypothetical protein